MQKNIFIQISYKLYTINNEIIDYVIVEVAMNIGVVGVNHNVAPIDIREKVSFTDVLKIECLNILLDREIDEAVILSTCNRSEIYIQGRDIKNKIKIVEKFYEEFFGLPDIQEYLFSKQDKDA